MQRGARWDGTLDPKQPALGNCTGNFGNDFAAFTPDYIQFLRVFAETQMDVYENASGAPDSGSAGWFFCQSTAALSVTVDRTRPSAADHESRAKVGAD